MDWFTWRRWIAGVLFLGVGLSAAARAGEGPVVARRAGPFILGADISWVQEDEANGAVYYDHGERRDIFEILKGHGFNAVRLRVFVNPKSAGGYAATSKEAFCDEAHTLAMAKRAHDAGMGLLIDFH